MGLEEENTLASFQKAIELGCDMVELDVHLKDGELFVLHDEEDWNPRTPRLKEVFDLVSRKAGINVELKGDNTAGEAARLIKEYLLKGWKCEDFLISSFKTEELENFSKLCPEIKIGYLVRRGTEEYIQTARKLKAFSVNIEFDLIKKDKNLVDKIHQEGFKVLVWTVNSPRKIKWLAEAGADGIITDYPNRLK